MSRLSESLSDGLTSVELALAPRPPRRDSKEDASDPNNWTEAALRTFLASRERVRPNETRDELQRRCCQILGRKYVPVASSSNDDQRADSEAAVRGLSYSIEKEEREQAALMARLQVQRSDSPAGNTGIFVSEAEAEEIALFQKLNPQAAVEPKGKRGRPPKPLGRPEGASSSSSHAPGPADVSDPFLDHMQQQLGRGGAAASSSTHQRPRQRSSDGRERRRSSGEHHEEKGGESSKPASRASSKELKREKRASRERKESAENAIKRVNAWSEGRSFVQLINSLPEAFANAPPAGIADVSSKEAPLPHDASGSQLKKAFHKASKSLHPDKLRELPTNRRVEAEEVFKSVSAAYHAIEAGA